jgi:hypothetical protein
MRSFADALGTVRCAQCARPGGSWYSGDGKAVGNVPRRVGRTGGPGDGDAGDAVSAITCVPFDVA